METLPRPGGNLFMFTMIDKSRACGKESSPVVIRGICIMYIVRILLSLPSLEN